MKNKLYSFNNTMKAIWNIFLLMKKLFDKENKLENEIEVLKEQIEQLKKNDFENYKELSKKIDFEIDQKIWNNIKEKQPSL